MAPLVQLIALFACHAHHLDTTRGSCYLQTEAWTTPICRGTDTHVSLVALPPVGTVS